VRRPWHPDRQLGRTAGLPLLLALVLFCGGLAVVATIAGWHDVRVRLEDLAPWWLPIAFAAEAVAFAGYVWAYRGVARVEGGRRLSRREAAALVAVGFGAFIVKGGGLLDAQALGSHGDDEEGERRVLTLDALEHAPLAPAACIAAIVLLVQGQHKPGLDFTIPWAVLVPLGAGLAALGVRRRDRFAGRTGWRGKLGRFLEAVHLLFLIVTRWRRHWPALAGSFVYWAGDVACLIACVRTFSLHASIPGIILAHAVGYVLTRRTFPLGGAGSVDVLLPLTLAAAGTPFSGAVLAVFVYRILNLWLPVIPALAALPHVRRQLAPAASGT
jgi:uncharacterized membrane protein YbhN (UPF0104 family)